MNIIFLIPPIEKRGRVPERVFGCSYGLYPIPNIFILTFASILRNDGNPVEIVDAPILRMDPENFYNYITEKFNACFIFYTVNLSAELDINIAKKIRKEHPNSPIIFCGPAPTYQPERFILDEKSFVARGEPDLTLKELIQFLRGDENLSLDKIKGITYLKKDKIINNPMRNLMENLDELPVPARNLIPTSRYYNPKLKEQPFTIVLTSRGCPYYCHFCVPCSLNFARKIEYQRYMGLDRIPPVAFASAERVINEFEILKREGYKSVSIIDDEFLLKSQRVKDICRGIKRLEIKWGCLARADHLEDEELIRLMAESGCQYVDIGVESFNQGILDDLNKNLDVNSIYKAVKLLKKYNIEPKLNILVGASPLETIETIKETINRTLSLKPGLVMFNICTPFPGTELYLRAKKEKWFVKDDYYPADVQKEAIIQYPHLKKEEIERIVKKANSRFYFRFYYILSNLRTIFNIKNLLQTLKGIFKKLF